MPMAFNIHRTGSYLAQNVGNIKGSDQTKFLDVVDNINIKFHQYSKRLLYLSPKIVKSRNSS